MTLENDDLEELTNEIRRLIESNKDFLERVNDEEYEEDEAAESGPDPEPEDFEEL
jgi:hypothetical protein